MSSRESVSSRCQSASCFIQASSASLAFFPLPFAPL